MSLASGTLHDPSSSSSLSYHFTQSFASNSTVMDLILKDALIILVPR